MRKKIVIFIYLLLINNAKSQASYDTGGGHPVASAAALSTYINSPPSIVSGTANIGVPLISQKLGNTEINISANYSPVLKNQIKGNTELGIGWSVSNLYAITREIGSSLDKTTDLSNLDDIYYYSIPGYSGKFKIIEGAYSGEIRILSLTPSNIKINFTRKANSTYDFFETLTITDTQGNEYFFDKTAIDFSGGVYSSIFYLTKITNKSNSQSTDFLNIEYGYVYQKPFLDGTGIAKKVLKPSKMTMNGIGVINFNYSNHQNQDLGEPFKLNFISLTTPGGKQISRYIFDYNNDVLTGIKKYGQNTTDYEQTSFGYDQEKSEEDFRIHKDSNAYGLEGLCRHAFFSVDFNYSTANPKPWTLGGGVLNRIIYPMGGVTEYDYELHKEYFDRANPSLYYQTELQTRMDPEVQYTKLLGDDALYFNLHQPYGTQILEFTIDEPKVIYMKTVTSEKYPLPIGGTSPYTGLETLYMTASLKKNNIAVPVRSNVCSNPDLDFGVLSYNLTPGIYQIEVKGTGGNGYIELHEQKTLALPLKNERYTPGYGLRIKNIKQYNSAAPGTVPEFVTAYQYDQFANPNNSSGEYYEFSTYSTGSDVFAYTTAMLYKNVTVKKGNGMGYSQYTYKTPADYPRTQSSSNYNYWPYLNLTKNGLLYKEEVFDAQNYLKAQNIFDPVINEIDMPDYFEGHHSGYYTKTAFIKKEINTAKTYFDNASRHLEVISESERDSGNYNVIHSTITNSDGTTDEAFYQYASDKGSTNLIDKNILTTPLETEIKKNGEVISKAEVKYENTGNIYPSYNLSYSMNDLSNAGTAKKDVKFDSYDERGNIVQYTISPNAQGEGFPVTMIWGYNKTSLIVKIEGAKLNQLDAAAINNLVALSDDYANATTDFAAKETAFVSALESFRTTNSADYQVTCYSYYPLVGVSEVIPPSGIKEIYEYDAMNRLQRVKNADGVIIKEIEYHHKP